MNWTFVAAADRKTLGSDGERFIFGEAVQQVASEYEDFAQRLHLLKPHITFYDSMSAKQVLESERISADDLKANGINLSNGGGAQIVCSGNAVFVNLYAGSTESSSLFKNIERTLASNVLAISMTFSIPQLSHSRGGGIEFDQAVFLKGTPIFFGKLPELALVRRSVP